MSDVVVIEKPNRKTWPLRLIKTTDYGLSVLNRPVILLNLSKFPRFLYAEEDEQMHEIQVVANVYSRIATSINAKRLDMYLVKSLPTAEKVELMHKSAITNRDEAIAIATSISYEVNCFLALKGVSKVNDELLEKITDSLNQLGVASTNAIIGGNDAKELLDKLFSIDLDTATVTYDKDYTILEHPSGKKIYVAYAYVTRWPLVKLPPSWAKEIFAAASDELTEGTIGYALHGAPVPHSMAILKLRREKAALQEALNTKRKLGQTPLSSDLMPLEDIERRSQEAQMGYVLVNTRLTVWIASPSEQQCKSGINNLIRAGDGLGMAFNKVQYFTDQFFADVLPIGIIPIRVTI